MTDRLSGLLGRFALRARLLHSGPLRGVAELDAHDGAGHLHLVRRGSFGITGRDGRRQVVTEPSAIYCPRPLGQRVDARGPEGAVVVSAAIEFGASDENPLVRGLPDLLVIALADVPALQALQTLLFDEASEARCGHAAVVDRLAEVLVVQLLRFAIERRLVDAGVLAGLADPRLAKALTAMHADPGRGWSLEALAGAAGMSRARFAAHFASVVGVPAGEYLTLWRMGVAQGLLRRGRPVKQVAAEVGYAGATSFGRAFAKVVGVSPSAWLGRQRR